MFHVKHEFNIALVSPPRSQKTTSEHSTTLYMVYRPPSHCVLPISYFAPLTLCSLLFQNSMFHKKGLCSTWNKSYVTDCQCVSLWNTCGTLLLGRAVSDCSRWLQIVTILLVSTKWCMQFLEKFMQVLVFYSSPILLEFSSNGGLAERGW